MTIKELLDEWESVKVKCVHKNAILGGPEFFARGEEYDKWLMKCARYLQTNYPNDIQAKYFFEIIKDNETISYPMQVIDLKKYLYDGGVMLFVVYVKDESNSKIYYLELTPIKLKKLLEDADEQITKTVYLKPFPTDGDKKATIFLNCYTNCQMQSSFSDAELRSLDELQEAGVLEGITIPFSSVGVDDPQKAFLMSETYLYAKVTGSAIPQPVELISEYKFTNETINGNVCVGDNIYYSEYTIIKSAKDTKVKIGSSLTLTFKDGESSCKVNYSRSNMLRIRAKDLNFLIEVAKNNYFSIKGIKVPFPVEKFILNGFDIDKEQNHLSFLKQLVQVLDILNYNNDVDLSKLSDQNFRDLRKLIIAFVEKKPVSGLKEDLMPVSRIQIGDLRFVLLFQATETKGKYIVLDYFKTEMNVAYKTTTGEMIPTSQYNIFNADDLLKICNLRPSVLLPSYKRITGDNKYSDANMFLLELIKAYDISKGYRKDLLKTAKEFAEWLLSDSEKHIEEQIAILNYYQIIKRERPLNIMEISKLWEIAEDESSTDFYKVGAYLLLDQQVPAEKHFKKLTDEEKDCIKEYPIYLYWKSNP